MTSPMYLAEIRSKHSPGARRPGHPVLLSTSPTTVPTNIRPKVNHVNNVSALRQSHPSLPRRDTKEELEKKMASRKLEGLNVHAVSYANLSSLKSEQSEMYSPEHERLNQKLFPLRRNMNPTGITQSQSKQLLRSPNALKVDTGLPYLGSLPGLPAISNGGGEFTLLNSRARSQLSDSSPLKPANSGGVITPSHSPWPIRDSKLLTQPDAEQLDGLCSSLAGLADEHSERLITQEEDK